MSTEKQNYSVKQTVVGLLLCFLPALTVGQTLKQQALVKIDTLNAVLKRAETKGIDVLKEKMTIRTAQVFLKYADWDEANVSTNADYFKLVTAYKDTATQAATSLPDFERRDVIKMLDESTSYLQKLIDGVYFRKPTPKIDWTKASYAGNKILYNGKPVFLSDYTWKPGVTELTEYHGNLDGFYFDQNKVTNNKGIINTSLLNDLKTKSTGSLGFIFLGNKTAPAWSETEYGPGFKMREDTYTGYDIDNPGALKINDMLFKGTVPYMAGKKYSELGYMLCNEPHFYTTTTGTKLDWASGPVSAYTMVKFRAWLKTRHATIADLNTLWGTSFTDFDSVTLTIPIDNALQGTPKWYDWVTFNSYRVTKWYTSLKDTLRKYDPTAKVHLKIMPNLWTDNKRGHGIDFEAISEMSEILGNDAGTENAPMWGGPYDWQARYAYDWRELYMGYDFLKSVGPDKININSEAHFLSTGKSRDLFQSPIYVRSTFWAATTLGMNVSQTWFWPRLEDGSIKSNAGKGYAGSNCQQPRVTNEVASTYMDLNAYSDEITAMQLQRKPLRIFYSETSATNKPTHMDNVFELYETLNFEGVPLGFATQNIIEKQDNSLWDAILVFKTEFVTSAELNALQTYLNNGGTVIVDAVSLKKNEYGKALPFLTQGNGTLIQLFTAETIKTKALEIVAAKGNMPGVTIAETNSIGKKGCSWKCVKNAAGNSVISVVNLGKGNAKLTIVLKNATIGTACKDLLNGVTIGSTPTLKPNEVLFIEVTDGNGDVAVKKNSDGDLKSGATLYPNVTKGPFSIAFSVQPKTVEMVICNLNGKVLATKKFADTSKIEYNISAYSAGTYIVKIMSDSEVKSFMLLKQV